MRIFLSSVFWVFTVALVWVTELFAKTPPINCGGLPGCGDDGIDAWDVDGGIYETVGYAISLLIQYTAVIAVIMVMIGGIMYLVSGGEEEKISRAKKVITWALIGVVVSVMAYSVIEILNNFIIS